MGIHVRLASLLVTDQDSAVRFYTEVLGLRVITDLDFGGGARWVTVGGEGEGLELALEAPSLDAAKDYQTALFEQGIPQTALEVDDIAAEYERLSEAGVVFRGPPAAAGPVTAAMFEDTCGNLIQLYQTQD